MDVTAVGDASILPENGTKSRKIFKGPPDTVDREDIASTPDRASYQNYVVMYCINCPWSIQLRCADGTNDGEFCNM